MTAAVDIVCTEGFREDDASTFADDFETHCFSDSSMVASRAFRYSVMKMMIAFLANKEMNLGDIPFALYWYSAFAVALTYSVYSGVLITRSTMGVALGLSLKD